MDAFVDMARHAMQPMLESKSRPCRPQVVLLESQELLCDNKGSIQQSSIWICREHIRVSR